MTAPRQVLQGKTSLVTRRTARQEFLLKPAEATNALFGYLLAVASARYGVDVHAFVVMSNQSELSVVRRRPAQAEGLEAAAWALG